MENKQDQKTVALRFVAWKKKQFLLVVMLVVSAFNVKAQDTIIPFHYPGYEAHQLSSMIQMPDGEFLSTVLAFTQPNPNSYNVNYEGTIFYKVSLADFAIVDSLFIADSVGIYYMNVNNPIGDGCLRVWETHEADGNTYLRISHFDEDNLEGDPANDIVTFLCEGYGNVYLRISFIDSQNDLIVFYWDNQHVYSIARYGLDGTLKHSAQLPCFMEGGEFSQSPLTYYCVKRNDVLNIMLYMLDENFQIFNSYLIRTHFNEDVEYFEFSSSFTASYGATRLFPDGDDLVLFTPYVRDSVYPHFDNQGNFYGFFSDPDSISKGVAAAKIQLRTGQVTKVQRFNEAAVPSDSYRAENFGVTKMPDGGYLYAFQQTFVDDMFGVPLLVVVRLDSDLNVVWKRYSHPQFWDDYSYPLPVSCVMFEEGQDRGMAIYVAVANPKMNNLGGMIHLFIYDEGIVNVHEAEMFVRPYMFWPNPVSGLLHFSYSPDVQPKSIGIYDLQGRLVRLQSNVLESIDLQGLSSGQYVMKVTMEDGSVFTDKVVKE